MECIASATGEPHIKTMDGYDYNFNGLGEYTMLDCEKDGTQTIVQARTHKSDRAEATQFSAFAAQVHFDDATNSTKIEFRYDAFTESIGIHSIFINCSNFTY